jgi:hypothetical protein
MNNHILIKQGFYLPRNFRLFGIFIFLFGIGLMANNISPLSIIGGIAGLTLGFICFTTNSRLEIDIANRTFHDYIWILGLKTSKPERYISVDKIFINRVKSSTRTHSFTGKVNSFQDIYFKAFMKLDNGEKIFLQESKNIDQLLKYITDYAKRLNCEVQDNSRVDNNLLFS